ncbi:polyhydroxyalkanoic acid synthase PhaR subunit [Anoxybacillus calidus]|jgi:polyhydroxyalkanoic acid synthase PhaR subunit|uniref:Polyhydroxyalkanoic acid synthase PhaR subunit n=1 Tax=[Anoxybacillus] calidus TaxID=575178 RepID=A0A7W0BWK8_9BACL|nr:polyhydroxyalkanoic acid synthase subunit PhaR [Anoxybacillus calidus]MBA2872695.1 polyhydroxyalkanoic acid synthase PhaR subunit [Anoxybacillus calidus]
MNDQKVFDPFLAWKEMYDKAESYMGKMLGETMNSEDFSKWMGSVLNFNLQLQKIIKETTERTLWQANMPSKEDVANIASLVINVEEKIEGMEELLEEQQDSANGMKKEITKLKSDMKRLEGKVDKLLALFEKEERMPNGEQ